MIPQNLQCIAVNTVRSERNLRFFRPATCFFQSSNTTRQRRSLSSSPATEPSTIRHHRPIYVAATKQHVGKTSVSLALVSHFTKRFGPENVGYMKAVGQQCQRVWEESEDIDEVTGEKGHYVTIDKDVKLIRDHFRLRHLKFADMSPVLIPRGYTKSYLDGEIDHQSQMADIRRAYLNIVRSTTRYDERGVKSDNSITICEGTGHAGVGSVVGAGNARVAAELGADVVLVANGGLGKAFDELELNRSLCLVSCTLENNALIVVMDIVNVKSC